jgi:hypothetical protein
MKDMTIKKDIEHRTTLMKNLSEISLEEEKMEMMDAPILSANAQPFHPFYAPVNIAIFNDGVPSLTLMTESDLTKILHGIQDDALDEGFPPDAQDAAELEAAEAFVETMADLARMEEREEEARDFVHIKKRWEVRRSEGLIGRPHAAKHSVDPVMHLPKATGISSLIHYSHAAQRMFALGDKMRVREMKERPESRHAKMNGTNSRSTYSFSHQPRKHN